MSWAGHVSRAGNIIVNPSGTDPGFVETPLRGNAWWILDLSPVWGFPQTIGDNIRIGGTNGRIPYPVDLDQGVYTMAIQVCGDVDRNASATPSGAIQGLRDNLSDLWANVGPAPYPSAYRDAILVEPDGTEIPCQIQTRLQLGRTKGSEAWVAIDVTVPSGRIE